MKGHTFLVASGDIYLTSFDVLEMLYREKDIKNDVFLLQSFVVMKWTWNRGSNKRCLFNGFSVIFQVQKKKHLKELTFCKYEERMLACKSPSDFLKQKFSMSIWQWTDLLSYSKQHEGISSYVNSLLNSDGVLKMHFQKVLWGIWAHLLSHYVRFSEDIKPQFQPLSRV